MSYHTDKKVNAAITNLLDELCAHERATGEHSTVVIIPSARKNKTLIAINGKPAAGSLSAYGAVELACYERTWGK